MWARRVSRMAQQSNRLTAVKVAKITKPGRYGDGGGLWLQVAPGGSKQWLFRYQRAGRARQMGIGPVHAISLVEARQRAQDARRRLVNGIDPIEAKRDAKAAENAQQARAVTFRQAAEAYIAAHKAGWKNEKHQAQWPATLEAYAYPLIGGKPVAAIDTGAVLCVLQPIWTEKPETAGRVRGRIESVLDWAKARDYRDGENPARWRGHLDKLLPPKSKVRKVRHHPAMPYSNVPAFTAKLRSMDSLSARALEFAILTAARTGETIGAMWDEIDLRENVWTVPAERMKASREHRVPLSARAVEILRGLPRIKGNAHVFPGARKAGLSQMALLMCLRGIDGVDGFTVHGFRSSFRDWAGEQTAFPREVAEDALAHALKDKSEAAYRRGDALEKRRKLMSAWGAFCGKASEAGGVVPMRRPA